MDIFVHHSKIDNINPIIGNSLPFGVVLIDFDVLNFELIDKLIDELYILNMKIVAVSGVDSETIHDHIDNYLSLRDDCTAVTTWHDLTDRGHDLDDIESLLDSFDLENIIYVYNLDKPYLKDAMRPTSGE